MSPMSYVILKPCPRGVIPEFLSRIRIPLSYNRIQLVQLTPHDAVLFAATCSADASAAVTGKTHPKTRCLLRRVVARFHIKPFKNNG